MIPMRHSQTAVIERGETYSGEFTSEPYEAPWAEGGRWFVQIIEQDADARIELVTQVSPDGITWCDAEWVPAVAATAPLTTWSIHDFGAWLRLRGNVSGGTARIRIYLVCKE